MDHGTWLRLTGNQARKAVSGMTLTAPLSGGPMSLYAKVTADDQAIVQPRLGVWQPAPLALAPLLRKNGGLFSFQDPPPDLYVLGVHPVASCPPGAWGYPPIPHRAY